MHINWVFAAIALTPKKQAGVQPQRALELLAVAVAPKKQFGVQAQRAKALPAVVAQVAVAVAPKKQAGVQPQSPKELLAVAVAPKKQLGTQPQRAKALPAVVAQTAVAPVARYLFAKQLPFSITFTDVKHDTPHTVVPESSVADTVFILIELKKSNIVFVYL
jgi:hypothetical protein